MQALIRKNTVSRYWTRSISWVNYLQFIELSGVIFFLHTIVSFCALWPNRVLGDEKEIIVTPTQVTEKQFTHALHLVRREETAQ